MKMMSSEEIKDRYGVFAETARREPVIHTSHGRPTLVTISIDRAKKIPELQNELGVAGESGREERLARLMAMAGIGEKIVGPQTAEDIEARIRFFRGDDA